MDKEEKVLYQTTKSEVREKGLLHPTVIAGLINSRGEFTLVKQAAGRQDAGQYVSPTGGHVLAGESIEGALRREVLEEMGLENFDFHFIGKAIFRRKF